MLHAVFALRRRRRRGQVRYQLGDLLMRHGSGPYGRDAVIEIIEDAESDIIDRLTTAVFIGNKCIDCFIASGEMCSACWEKDLEAEENLSNVEKEVIRMVGQGDEIDPSACAICKKSGDIKTGRNDAGDHYACQVVKSGVDEAQIHWARVLIDEQRAGKRKLRVAMCAGIVAATTSGVLGALLGKAACKWSK